MYIYIHDENIVCMIPYNSPSKRTVQLAIYICSISCFKSFLHLHCNYSLIRLFDGYLDGLICMYSYFGDKCCKLVLCQVENLIQWLQSLRFIYFNITNEAWYNSLNFSEILYIGLRLQLFIWLVNCTYREVIFWKDQLIWGEEFLLASTIYLISKEVYIIEKWSWHLVVFRSIYIWSTLGYQLIVDKFQKNKAKEKK